MSPRGAIPRVEYASFSIIKDVMEKDSNEYKFIRKIFLDGFNDYTRSVMRTLFGNVEGLIMK